LSARGISDEIINHSYIGWNGKAVTIPIFDTTGNFSFFKYRKDPSITDESAPKYWYDAGTSAELYGWENIHAGRSPLIICEGELDRLALESRGFRAVTSTGGALTFKQSWLKEIKKDVDVYVCYDCDVAGREGMSKVAKMLPRIKFILLTSEVEEGGDITDYFTKQSKTVDDFKALMESAPLYEDEQKKIAPEASVEKDKTKKPSLTDELMDLVLGKEGTLFHDQFGNAFIAFTGDGSDIVKLNSKRFKNRLRYSAYDKLGKEVTKEAVEKAVSVMQGKAVYEGKIHELDVRIVYSDGCVWYDMGDGRAVKITSNGWKITEQPPILFRKLSHQKKQVIPLRGGNLEELFQFIPEPKQPGERLLLLVWLVVAVIQGFPHPVLVVHGPQGSRKTTLFKILRQILDPSLIETLPPQHDLKEFTQLASHHFFLPMDNLSRISGTFSDALCRAVTGGGFSKRELYTDDDDVIYSFRRIIGINGINLVVDKPDLLERSLILGLERPEKYIADEELFLHFEKKLPYLLGSLFDIVTKTLKEGKSASVPPGLAKYRMADFALWGLSAARVLGYETRDFISALQENLERQHEEAIDASPVAQTILSFMEDKSDWCGSPSQLLSELEKVAESLKINTKQKPFPQGANWLWKRIVEIKINLQSLGLHVSKDRGGERLIRFTKVNQNPVGADDGVDAVSSLIKKGPDGKREFDRERISQFFKKGQK